MIIDKAFQTLTLVAAATTVFVTFVEFSNIPVLQSNRAIIYFSLVGFISFSWVFWIGAKTIRNKEIKLKMAVIGRVGVGKTVFVTALFRELITDEAFNFNIRGKKHSQAILRKIQILTSGVWLPATSTSSNQTYGGAILKRRLFDVKYDIEFGDFSGEKYQKLADCSLEDNWLHNNDFFDYLKSCDALLLAAEAILENNNFEVYDYIAALNLLSSDTPEKKSKTPILLLFLQSDRLDEKNDKTSKEKILLAYDDLIRFCQTRFHNFDYFFVSSVGEDASKFSHDIKSAGANKISINSINLKEVFQWCLKKCTQAKRK